MKPAEGDFGIVIGDEVWRDLPRRWAVAGLAVANLAPLVGVLAFGWSAAELLVFYWLETGVVVAANVPKVFLAGGALDELRDGRPVAVGNRLLRVSTFVLFYGVFWAAYGAIVLLIVEIERGTEPVASLVTAGLLLAVGATVVSQAVEFWTDYLGGGRHRHRSPKEQMHQPYRRVAILQLVILIGVSPMVVLDSPLVGLVLLVVFKLLAELRQYRRSVVEGGATEGSPGLIGQ